MATNSPGRSNHRIIRRPRLRDMQPRVFRFRIRRPSPRIFASPLILLYGFVILIGSGGFLLALPIASVDNTHTRWEDAFFTSTSAVTVTGLTVLDTAQHWSSFGQGVIFVLMLLGGLGFMVFATFLLTIIGQRLSISDRLLIRDTLGGDRIGGVIRLLRRIVMVVMVIYAVGTLLIFWQMLSFFPVAEALWQSAFLAVSSFNNAGLTIVPGSSSLEGLDSKIPILIFLGGLIILGGIGWSVTVDIFRRRSFSRFNLDTKMIVVTSLLLWVAATSVFLFSEYSNEATIGSRSVADKVGVSIFEAISARTAGFTALNITGITDLTKLFFITMMFIGGAAGSVAGGIKVGTFAVIAATVLSSIRGRQQTEAFGREVPRFVVYRAITVVVLGGGIIFVTSLALEFTESASQFPFLDLLFDTVSAFGTTGLSMGIVPLLTVWGKIMLMVVMVLGRLGPLALALALTPQNEGTVYRYAQEGIRIG